MAETRAIGQGVEADPLGQLFLERLAHLVELRRAWRARVATVPPELLWYALGSTYDDCVRLGLRAQARRLLGLPGAGVGQ